MQWLCEYCVKIIHHDLMFVHKHAMCKCSNFFVYAALSWRQVQRMHVHQPPALPPPPPHMHQLPHWNATSHHTPIRKTERRTLHLLLKVSTSTWMKNLMPNINQKLDLQLQASTSTLTTTSPVLLPLRFPPASVQRTTDACTRMISQIWR